jgi:hypothetical protein
MRDSWTGEIKKFSVNTDQIDTVLFYSPNDVSEASESNVKLNIAFGEVNLAIQFGARVFDKNDQYIGTVDYPVSNSFTGKVEKFKVKPVSDQEALIFSIEDVEKVTPDEVRLKIALAKSP